MGLLSTVLRYFFRVFFCKIFVCVFLFSSSAKSGSELQDLTLLLLFCPLGALS